MSILVARVDPPAAEPSSGQPQVPLHERLIGHLSKDQQLAIPNNQWSTTKFTWSIRSYVQRPTGSSSGGRHGPGGGSVKQKTMSVVQRYTDGVARDEFPALVVIEDPSAPTRSENESTATTKGRRTHVESPALPDVADEAPDVARVPPTHYRHTVSAFSATTFDALLGSTFLAPASSSGQSYHPASSATSPLPGRWTLHSAGLSLDGCVATLSSAPAALEGSLPDWWIRILAIRVRGQQQPWAIIEIEYLPKPDLPPDSPFLRAALDALLFPGCTASPLRLTQQDLVDADLLPSKGSVDPAEAIIHPQAPVSNSMAGRGLAVSKAGASRRHWFDLSMLLKREGLL